MGRGLDTPGGRAKGLWGARAPELSTSAPAPEPQRGRTFTEGAGAAYQAVPPGAPYTSEPPCNRRNRHTPQHTTSFRARRFDDAISTRAKRPRPHPWARPAAPPLALRASVFGGGARGRSRASPVAADLGSLVLGCPRHRCPGLAAWAPDTTTLLSPSKALVLEISRDSPSLQVELDFFSSSGADTSAMQRPPSSAFLLYQQKGKTSKCADYDVASQQSYSELLFMPFWELCLASRSPQQHKVINKELLSRF